jgi:hypothetical protein
MRAKLDWPSLEVGILSGMARQPHISDYDHLKILSAEKDGEDGVLVKFSDGTITGYVVEESLRPRPIREKVEEPILVPIKKRM